MKCVWLTVLFIASVTSLFSQDNLHAIKRCPEKIINYEQGLSNNNIIDVITDNSGFTWFSTYTGLQRYNGYVLETIQPEVDNKKVEINEPVNFFSLKNGNIWMSYKDGVLQYNSRTNTFTKVISFPDDNHSFSIIPVKENNEGIWCFQYNMGLVVYSLQGKLLKCFLKNNQSIQNAFNYSDVVNKSQFTSNNRTIFITTSRNTILGFDLETKQTHVINTNQLISLSSNNDYLFIVTHTCFSKINLQKKQAESKVALSGFLKDSVNNSAALFKNKSGLLLSLNNHLFEFDTAGNYEREITSLSRMPVVNLGFVRRVYEDGFKRIWLLTNDDIRCIQNFNIPFAHFIYPDAQNNFVRSIYYDEEKHIVLAGCYNGGIQLYDSLGNSLWQKALSTPDVKDINGIEKLSSGTYLIETIGKGWFVLSLPAKKLMPFPLTAAQKNIIRPDSVNFINTLQRINDSTIDIGTSTNVYSCVFKYGRLTSFTALLPFNLSASQQADCFFFTPDSLLWMGTNNGFLYELKQNKLLAAINVCGNHLIRSINQDASKNLWVGTDVGLYAYANNRLLKIYTTQNGLLNNCIYSLLPVTGKPAVFASSNMGLSYVQLNNIPINYTKESGLQENEFNTEAACKTANGKYFFGGINGITAFYSAMLGNIKDSPLVNIIKFVVNDAAYKIPASLNNNDSVFLHYNQNHIELDFAAMGMLNTNEYTYHYRLKGFETSWQTTHTPTAIKYVLQPGIYTFEIKCSPVFSSNTFFEKTLFIAIAQPWWQTGFFKTAVSICIAALLFFSALLYYRRRYAKKIKALEVKQMIEQERQRISRDLHDNLGAYAAAIAVNIASIKEKERDNVYDEIKENSQAIINQLNDTIWALNKQEVSFTAISDHFKVFLQKIKSSYAHINIDLNENIQTDIIFSPINALHLFRIMQEAINNALRHSECSNISVHIISNATWKIIIKDDGKGLPATYTSGNGLKNIHARAAEAGWLVKWMNAVPYGTEVVLCSTIN